jgi:hypothetical protein
MKTVSFICKFFAFIFLLISVFYAIHIHRPWVAGSVRLEDLINCHVVLGPCQTSVYLENVVNSTLWICCHQLRIHNCNNSSLYVRANSHPIIEDCSNLGFAPYSLQYETIEADLEVSVLTTVFLFFD